MTKKWKMIFGAALLAFCLPALALAAPSKEELMLKAHQSNPAKAAKATERDKAREAKRAQVQQLHAKKRELMLQKRAVLKDKAKTDAIDAQIKQVNSDLKKAVKGGAK